MVVLFNQLRKVGNRKLADSDHDHWMDKMLCYAKTKPQMDLFLV